MHYNTKESGQRIRQLRNKNSLTQEQLASVLGINRSFYSRIETGESACSIELLVQLADTFNVSIDYLVLGKVNNALFKDTERALLKKDIEDLMSSLEQIHKVL